LRDHARDHYVTGADMAQRFKVKDNVLVVDQKHKAKGAAGKVYRVKPGTPDAAYSVVTSDYKKDFDAKDNQLTGA